MSFFWDRDNNPVVLRKHKRRSRIGIHINVTTQVKTIMYIIPRHINQITFYQIASRTVATSTRSHHFALQLNKYKRNTYQSNLKKATFLLDFFTIIKKQDKQSWRKTFLQVLVDLTILQPFLVIMIMEEELGEKNFQSRLHYIKDKYLSYVRINQSSSFVILGLHEHLGLANYFRIILQALSNNQVSIIIPNLFGQVQEQSNNEEEDEKFLKQLNQAIVAQTVADVFDEIKSQGKKVIVVGLSIGAAVGLKMLEYLQGVEFSMFFYGLPLVAQIRPERIKSRTIIYCGEKDHVKHLSNKHMVSAAKLKYSENKFVEFYDIPGLDHGFMNPASQHYDEEAFHRCCKHFQDTLGRLTKNEEISREKLSKQVEPEQPNEENNEQKKEGSCSLI